MMPIQVCLSSLSLARRLLKLGLSGTGRSVAVLSGDVAGAASRLDRIVGSSGIAREWWTNRRHKPKGEERRKLASTRWRRRFKLEVSVKIVFPEAVS